MDLYSKAVSAEMRSVLQADATPDELHSMMHYHMGWVDQTFTPNVVPSGKMIRPALLLMACEAAGGVWQDAVPAAAAIELLHNFSLIHDDIEDRSDTRRGRTTTWRIWGVPLAINVGDAMFASAQLAMTRLADKGVPSDIVVTALRRFNETCVALTQGQHADMRFETREDVLVDEYMAMIRGKTAVLVALSAELGALIAGKDGATVAHYHQFGLQTGLAFQVIDDILGIWGDEAVIGKSAESDILTKKKTLPVLYGLEKSAALRDHYTHPADSNGFVTKAVALLDAAEARSFAEAEAQRHTDSAMSHLKQANPQGDAAIAIDQLASLLLRRNA